VLAKLPETERNSEIDRTNILLEKISGVKTELFRAPYGARNAAIIDPGHFGRHALHHVEHQCGGLGGPDPGIDRHADSAPDESTAQGDIVLHDIHKQSVMAISPVVEELLRQEYSFLAFDKGQFTKFERPSVTERSSEPAQPPAAPPDGARKLYRDSWAVIIGVNDYQKWPKLRYAVNDANGMKTFWSAGSDSSATISAN